MNIIITFDSYTKIINSTDAWPTRSYHFDETSPPDYQPALFKIGLKYITYVSKKIKSYSGYMINEYLFKFEVIDEPLFMLFAIKYGIEFEVEIKF